MNFKELIKNNLIYLDGGLGSILQEQGLKLGEYPERWNITNSEIIKNIHLSYFNAGSNIVCTNTFGANILKFSNDELENIIKCAIENAKHAKNECNLKTERFIALDVGPLGKMLKPYGDLDFERAVEIFKTTVLLGVKYGVDLVFIETMSDSYETKAALLAVKEACDLPVFVSNAYCEDGKLLTGANPLAMISMLEGMGADAIGVNCSLGPKALMPVINEYIKYSSTPIILKPNAGLPKVIDDKTIYDVNPFDFSLTIKEMASKGVNIVGGCCGTTPEYIKSLVDATKNIKIKPITKKEITVVSSYTHAVVFDKEPILIGERINPTGKKAFKQALINNDIDYILKEGVSQEEKGVHILDVNVGIPDISENDMLKKVVFELQSITNLPLQIDTSNIKAMENALRIYNGKPLINSVNGKKESMNKVFPLVKKYGGVVIALTLDENGIPNLAEDRFKIAKKILKVASSYGISKKDVIFDPLALTVSADSKSGVETLKAIELIKNKLNAHVSIGVSNVSFGLPIREYLNSTFFALALSKGLSCAIINPNSNEILKTYYTFRALNGLDDNFTDYINFCTNNTQKEQIKITEKIDLKNAIIKGLKDSAILQTKELLKTVSPFKIIEEYIIPALDVVGKGYENKTLYLPSLLISAEASKASFDVIKESLPKEKSNTKCKIVIATVKGDIHDIGKNIVKLLLENYGFDIIDLGKDVDSIDVLNAVLKHNAPILCLSALMTTTVSSMEYCIKLIKKKAKFCKIIVGGAVLTEDYAKKINADYYAKDGMEGVRIATKINENLKMQL